MSKKIRPLIAFLTIAAATLASAPTASAACADEDLRPTPENVERVRNAVVCLHNEERKAAGVAPLSTNSLLQQAATAHSVDMVERDYFEHDAPEGIDPFERIERAGYIRPRSVWNAGENIGWGTGSLSTPRSMMDAWMKSYGHRLTLIASDFDELGVGIALGSPSAAHAQRSDAVTYTVDFGWREKQAPRAVPSCLRRAAHAKTKRARQSARSRCRGARHGS